MKSALNISVLLRGLVVSTGVLVLFSCSSAKLPSVAEVAMVVPRGTDSSLESRVFDEINRYRAENGKGVLTRHPGLDKLARYHSQQMLKEQKLSHKGYHHRLGMAEVHLKVEELRENVFYSRGIGEAALPERTLRGWHESKGHRMNLLANTHFCGVGVARDSEGRYYATQLVGKPGDVRSFYRAGMPKSYSNVFGVGTGGADW